MTRILSGRLVIATHNPGKLREMTDLLAPYGLEIVSAAQLKLAEPEETGDSFSANAALKARAAAQASGLPALADDSGLCVARLCVAGLEDGPGVHSARFAQQAGGFDPAMAELLACLESQRLPKPWSAWFASALAVAWPDEAPMTFLGRVDGTLVPPRGKQGFGYDPIFLPEGYDRTFGEMASAEKHGLPKDGSRALSHRARAFQDMARALMAPPKPA